MMFLYNLLTAFIVLHAVKSSSMEQDLFGLTDFLEPITLDPLQTSDSLFLAEVDESTAAGGLESFYSTEDLNFDKPSVKISSLEDESSAGDTSALSSEEDIFASSNPSNIFDEGDISMAQALRTPCEANLIERSINFDQSTPEELADSSQRDYCLPSKTTNPPPQLDLPNDLNDLDDLLNPKPSGPLLDPLLRIIPYRVVCPLDGDYNLVCCAEGNGTKRVKCVRCKFSCDNI